MNSKQGWNKDKCRCAWIEQIHKGISDKGFIWNPSNCECECDNSWNVGEYVDYSDSKYRKKVVDELVEECIENINENELIYDTTSNDHENNVGLVQYIYIVLFSVF